MAALRDAMPGRYGTVCIDGKSGTNDRKGPTDFRPVLASEGPPTAPALATDDRSRLASRPHDGHSKADERQRPHRGAVGDDAIRRIFPLFVLAMWVVAGFMVANDAWSGLHTRRC